jgi:DNA-binding PadR family transcriptional regulator
MAPSAMPTEPTSTPLTPAVFHVLLALSDGALHGYAIMQRVEETSGLDMGPGTIYGSIRRLSEAGWVEEADDNPSDPRRGRSWVLTELGARALGEEARRITRLAGMPDVRRLAAEAS